MSVHRTFFTGKKIKLLAGFELASSVLGVLGLAHYTRADDIVIFLQLWYISENLIYSRIFVENYRWVVWDKISIGHNLWTSGSKKYDNTTPDPGHNMGNTWSHEKYQIAPNVTWNSTPGHGKSAVAGSRKTSNESVRGVPQELLSCLTDGVAFMYISTRLDIPPTLWKPINNR